MRSAAWALQTERATTPSAIRDPPRLLLGGLQCRLQPILRGNNALHDLEIAIAQLQAGVGPDLNDTVEFLEQHRIDHEPGLEDAAVADMPALGALYVVARGLDALPRLNDHVDQAGVLH